MSTAAAPTKPKFTWDPKTGELTPEKPSQKRLPWWARLLVWLIRDVAWGLVTLVAYGLGVAVVRAVKAATVGPHRTRWVPAWVAIAAAVGTLIPGSTVAWLVAAVAVGARPGLPREQLRVPWRWLIPARRYLSDRECLLASRASASLAGWTTFIAPLPVPYMQRAMILAVIVGAAAVPWWHGRRVRPAAAPGFPHLWEEVVTPALPATAGEWTEWDDEKGSGVLTLHGAKASSVARMDEDVEAALARHAGMPVRRGMVTIANDPQLLVHQVRVVLSKSPEDMANQSRYWDGPTLNDPDGSGRHRKPGMYLLAVTKTGQEVWVKHRDVKNGRARFFSWDGPTGTGKGGSMRISIVESACDPDTLTLIADGKWGAGLGYCRAGAASYADTPDAVGEQADRVIAVLRARAARYGREGRDSFTPRPGDPQIEWIIDELPRILASPVGRKVAAALNEIGAIGGSFGVVAKVAKQRGDAGSWGFGVEATTTRTNFSGGGGRWVGPSDDTQGHRSNQQGNTDLDASKLPRTGGWCYIIDGDPNPPPSRGIWLPNRRDVSEKGAENRYGTVEDWLEARTIHPELRADEYDILLSTPLPDAESTAGDAREVVTITKPVPAEWDATTNAVIDLLPDDDEPGITVNDLRILLSEARRIERTDRQLRNILNGLAEDGEASATAGEPGTARTWNRTRKAAA